MYRSLRTGVALAAAIAVALAACSRNAPEAESMAAADMAAAQAPAAPPAPAAEKSMAGGQTRAEEAIDSDAPTARQLTSAANTYTDARRKFIRNAQAEFKVADVYRSALAIEDAVAARGGFVV